MKARLYRATGEARNFIDGYTLYFPYPKWYLEEFGYKSRGTFLACSPALDGTIYRCYWGEMEPQYTFAGLGRKVKISSMPEAFQKEVARMQALWDEACKTRNFDRWNEEA